MPRDEDWKAIIKYSQRIKRIAYDESSNNVTPSIFTVFEESRPVGMSYILPRLQELTWKVETSAALDRCTLFLNPDLQFLNLDVGSKLPKLNNFLVDMANRTNLKGFSFVSPTPLPDAFTELLSAQDGLEKVALVAPGALSPGIGRWVAALPQLKNLQLDLTGRAPIAVEGFFDELLPRSGDSTPSSIGSRDSGVFSGEELDFTEIRKSALRLTGDLPPKGSFTKLCKLQLTGEVANIAVFLKHLDSALVHLELVIEDPPDNADWLDLSELICSRFSRSLQSMRIIATPSSRFADLVRSTSRAEPPTGRLALDKFVGLSKLTKLEIDLPESVVFIPADIESLAKACPRLEILKLCPLSRFPPPHSPKLTLESLIPLTAHCRNLHTLAVVFNATPGSEKVLRSQKVCSPSLLRLHAGHSWGNDPLQISILLSHMMPKLELLKWFQEKNRTGFIEAHAKTWQSVSDILPHVQALRSTERSFVRVVMPELPPPPPVIETSDKGIDATVSLVSIGTMAQPQLVDVDVQFSPELVSVEIDATVGYSEVSIDATPAIAEMGVAAVPEKMSASVSAVAPSTSTSTSMGTSAGTGSDLPVQPPPPISSISMFPSILNFLSFAYRFVTLPISLTSRILQAALAQFQPKSKSRGDSNGNGAAKSTPLTSVSIQTGTEPSESIPMDNLQVRQ